MPIKYHREGSALGAQEGIAGICLEGGKSIWSGVICGSQKVWEEAASSSCPSDYLAYTMQQQARSHDISKLLLYSDLQAKQSA